MADRSLLSALGSEVLSSRELQQRLGISQPTLSRQLRGSGARVVRLGQGPTTRYAAVQPVFGLAAGSDLDVPIYAVNEASVLSQIATLQMLANGNYLVRPALSKPHGGAVVSLLGVSQTGLFVGLPYFIYDLRPAGFLGRQVAHQLATLLHGEALPFPADPRDWRDPHIGSYLLRWGDDLPGNLVVGHAAAHRINQRTDAPTSFDVVDYPKLAQRALGQDAPGSSAAGEQPKFVIYRRGVGHVIVKFSPAGLNADAQRWRDLLCAEYHALDFLRQHGIDTAVTTLHHEEGRIFLESQRFDRVGDRGRRACISLAMIDAEFVGAGHSWSQVAQGLHQQRLISADDEQRIRFAETFGLWIGNSDMHLGNMSLAPTLTGFRLLPLYDMLPMGFAPVRGDLRDVQLRPPLRMASNESVWASSGTAAAAYWSHLTGVEELSDDFRSIAQAQAQRIRAAIG